ncbi:hypothetical protein AXFE_31050 [Acidithrix ferrooxidans]|uniref:Uncharacterized protein n=1 Tax=Acidithrix ferrooxidans TaxID=1280514 RepID=A0A0D8HG34_9ACTN|nr:hypothetical protein AXFE_31050 [Acidithrix ferrooxidans]
MSHPRNKVQLSLFIRLAQLTVALYRQLSYRNGFYISKNEAKHDVLILLTRFCKRLPRANSPPFANRFAI